MNSLPELLPMATGAQRLESVVTAHGEYIAKAIGGSMLRTRWATYEGFHAIGSETLTRV